MISLKLLSRVKYLVPVPCVNLWLIPVLGSVDSSLRRVVIFLVLGMTGDLGLYPEYLGYYIMALWVLLNLFLAAAPC